MLNLAGLLNLQKAVLSHIKTEGTWYDNLRSSISVPEPLIQDGVTESLEPIPGSTGLWAQNASPCQCTRSHSVGRL